MELNVGQTRDFVHRKIGPISFVLSPLPAEGDLESDPSHSEILGLPPHNDPDASRFGDLIARCVSHQHPTRS